MEAEHVLDSHPSNRFPFAPFFFWTGLQLAAAFGIFYWIAPQALAQELSQPGPLVLAVFLLGLGVSLFEYLYHRYLLHSAVLPFLGLMHKCHSEHHGLTNVKAPVTPKEPEKLVEVDSNYPIEHEHQEESMQFPYFAITVFFAVFLILFGLPLKLMMPGAPIITAVLITVTFSYAAYELWHAVLHMPFERYWRPWMERGKLGRMVEHIYSFHLMHHWRPTTNQAVVGFWGIALWDHLFGTHHRPRNLPLDKAYVNFRDAAIAPPRFPINLIDKAQPRLYKVSRRIEEGLLGLFGKKGR